MLARKAFAELLGSALLTAAVVGTGIAAQRLSPHDPADAVAEQVSTLDAG